MQLYLKTEPVGLQAEVNHLLIRIVEHSPAPFRVAVRFMERRIAGAEAAVESALEAATDPRNPARGGDRGIHRLRENPQLEPVPEGLGEEFLHGYVKIHDETHAAHRVNATDAPGSHEVSGLLHVAEEFRYGKGTGDVV